MTDRLQQLLEQAGSPLSVAAESVLAKIRSKRASVRIDFEAAVDPLATEPSSFVVALETTGRPQRLPWSPQLERELFRLGVRMDTLVGESLRAATNLAQTFRVVDIRYGDDFVDQTLWAVVYERYGSIPAVVQLLGQLPPNTQSTTEEFLDCKAFIERELDAYQNTLRLEFGYESENAYRAIVAALSHLLDQRHHLTARQSLFPGLSVAPSIAKPFYESDAYERTGRSIERPVRVRPEVNGQVFGYWFGPHERIPSTPQGIPTGAVLPRVGKKFPGKRLLCLDLVSVQNQWLVLSELGRYTYNHTTGLLRSEQWSFVPVPESTGEWPVVYAVAFDESLPPAALAEYYGADAASRARPDAPTVQLRLTLRPTGQVTKLTGGELETELRNGIPQLARTVSTGSAPVPDGPRSAAPTVPDRTLAESAPGGAIIAAWARLEDAIRQASYRSGVVVPAETRPSQLVSLIKRLHNVGAIDQGTLAALMGVRALRNKVAHTWDEASTLTSETAARYVAATDELLARLLTGADGLRLKALFVELGVNSASDVTVGQLAVSAVSGSSAAAKEVALSKRGQWGAKAMALTTIVSEEDAALLLLHGAAYVAQLS